MSLTLSIKPQELNFAFPQGDALPSFTITFKDFAGVAITEMTAVLKVLDNQRQEVKTFDTSGGISVAGNVATLQLESDLPTGNYHYYLQVHLPRITRPITAFNGCLLLFNPWRNPGDSTALRSLACTLPVMPVPPPVDDSTGGGYVLVTDGPGEGQAVVADGGEQILTDNNS